MYEGLRHAAELAREFDIPADATGRPRRAFKEFARHLDELAETHAPADHDNGNYPSLTLTGNLERDLRIVAEWVKRLDIDQLFIMLGLSVWLRERARERIGKIEDGE